MDLEEQNNLQDELQKLKMEIEQDENKESSEKREADNSNAMENEEVNEEDEKEKLNWQVSTASNGLKYYFNTKTQSSQWDKPFCLMTPEEKDGYSEWKECQTNEGKTFYYNSITKSKSWKIPQELKFLKEKMKQKNLEENKAVKENVQNSGGMISFSFVMTYVKFRLVQFKRILKTLRDLDNWKKRKDYMHCRLLSIQFLMKISSTKKSPKNLQKRRQSKFFTPFSKI